MSLRTQLCSLLKCPAVAPVPSPVVVGVRTPVVACINKSSVDLGLPTGKTFTDLVYTLQRYISTLLAPVWGTPLALKVATAAQPGEWALVFIDNADVADVLGYHELTADGFPLGKVFTQTTKAAGELVEVTASHELAEMAVDPAINLLATGSVRVDDVYAYEVADAVEEKPFIPLDGFKMSNFVFPTYFEDFHRSGTKYDYLGVLGSAFSLAAGGYMSVLKGGQWTQVFGSVEKGRRFAKEDRKGHRSELRAAKHQGLKFRSSVRK